MASGRSAKARRRHQRQREANSPDPIVGVLRGMPLETTPLWAALLVAYDAQQRTSSGTGVVLE